MGDAKATSTPASSIHRPSLIILTCTALLSIILDQGSKWLALITLTPGRGTHVIGHWFQLRLIFNSGAAFSLGSGQTWIFTILAVAVIIFVIVNLRRLRHRGWAFALGLLLGGAAGNLGDRLFRSPGFGRGHVVDFLDYNNWFIGNVADVIIFAAAVCMVILVLLGITFSGHKTPAQTRKHSDGGSDEGLQTVTGPTEQSAHSAPSTACGDTASGQ